MFKQAINNCFNFCFIDSKTSKIKTTALYSITIISIIVMVICFQQILLSTLVTVVNSLLFNLYMVMFIISILIGLYSFHYLNCLSTKSF